MEKKTFKETRFGALLSKVAPKAGEAIAHILPDKGVLGIVKNLIDSEPDISQEQKDALQTQLREFELTELKAILDDKADARDMQKEALRQGDLFSKRFIYYLTIFWSIVSAVYIFAITFFDILNDRVADTILGFLMGTIIASMMQFFFGSSQGSKDKTKALNGK